MNKSMTLEQIEIHLLLEAIYLRYGYDFSGYTQDTISRRIIQMLSKDNIETVAGMTEKILHEQDYFEKFVYEMSITVTEMFRDPSVYSALRTQVIPLLKTYPFVNIWHAGCATGQEVYSMAILLKEEGLYDRARIYATDINDAALQTAREGIYPVDQIPLYTRNYQKAGGTGSFADYYFAKYDNAKIDKSLKENITFASHNLVTDQVFAEMHLILCRNVFIYFGKDLQNHVFKLFKDSLCRGGILCLGNSESMSFSDIESDFYSFIDGEKIYRKKTSAVMGAT